MIGASATAAYSSRATARVRGSAVRSRSGSSRGASMRCSLRRLPSWAYPVVRRGREIVALGRKRKRRKAGTADVGTFERLPETPAAPLDQVIEDAVMIARSGVRLSVRNSIIVDALRDGLSYDEQRLEDRARAQYLELADENEAD